jgi:diaminopimelate epimerase
MKIFFDKYQGTGNDFILIDNRAEKIKLSSKQIAFLCNRNLGIGADGLMLLQKQQGYDFGMIYYNSNGKEGSMCGNGGRCMIKFAFECGIKKNYFTFLAPDGKHEGYIKGKDVFLKMKDVRHPINLKNDFFIDTGSPHYVRMVKDVKKIDVYSEGKKIRNSELFKKKGTNVNFVEIKNNRVLFVRTYERGVENETLSCGTGVTAAALTYCFFKKSTHKSVLVKTKGGSLKVNFKQTVDGFTDIWLIGPAVKVFSGYIEL